jgi:hypothetical protein
LAGTLCKAITGVAPPKANDRAFDDPFVPLAKRPDLKADYSSSFLRSVDRALAMKPADRWQDAEELLAALRKPITEYQQQLVHQEPMLAVRPAVSWKPETLVRNPEFKPSSTAPTAANAAAESDRKSNRVSWIVAACLLLALFAIAITISGNEKEKQTDMVTHESAPLQKREKAANAAATAAKEGDVPEEDNYDDFSNPLNVLRARTWVYAPSEERSAFLKDLTAKKDKTVLFVNKKGERADAPVWKSDGSLTPQGEEYIKKVRVMLQAAANDPDGGLYRNPYSGRIDPYHWLEDILEKPLEK